MYDNFMEETNQFLTFKLMDDLYALEIAKVREVMYSLNISKVPKMPEYFRGVINLREKVVPVIDLRFLLGMGKIEKTIDTCIIIVEIELEDELLNIGALADSVQEVTHIHQDKIVPPPKIGGKLKSDFILGMGKRDNDFIIILNIEKIMTLDQVEDIKSVAEAANTGFHQQYD